MLLSSCTPSIERVERQDSSMTDSAMSVLASIETSPDTITLERVQTIERVKTVSKEVVKYVEVESSPVFSAMVRPLPVYSIEEKRGRDTVYVYRVDTVFISR